MTCSVLTEAQTAPGDRARNGSPVPHAFMGAWYSSRAARGASGSPRGDGVTAKVQSSGPGRRGGERAPAGLAVPTVLGNLHRPPRCRGESRRAWEGERGTEQPLCEDSG